MPRLVVDTRENGYMHRFHHKLGIGVLIGICLGFTSLAHSSDNDAEVRKMIKVVANKKLSAAEVRKIIVVVADQKLLAMEGTKIVYEFDVVTGRPGKETTTGEYRIFRKVKDYHSRTYDSPMPYSMFFSKDGKAIHGTYLATIRSYLHAYVTESVGSMGCVGLTDEDAEALYQWTPKGTKIIVMTDEPEE